VKFSGPLSPPPLGKSSLRRSRSPCQPWQSQCLLFPSFLPVSIKREPLFWRNGSFVESNPFFFFSLNPPPSPARRGCIFFLHKRRPGMRGLHPFIFLQGEVNFSSTQGFSPPLVRRRTLFPQEILFPSLENFFAFQNSFLPLEGDFSKINFPSARPLWKKHVSARIVFLFPAMSQHDFSFPPWIGTLMHFQLCPFKTFLLFRFFVPHVEGVFFFGRGEEIPPRIFLLRSPPL